MTAAAQQDVPRRAQVVYTNVGPAVAWRIGDDAFVAPSVLTSWHWPFTLVGNDATIQAEGRTVRVAARAINNRMMIPLHDLFDQLGGVCSWRTDGSTMDVFGQVRIVSIRNGALCVDSTLSSKPHVFTLSGPSRVVVDLRGMRLDPKAAQGLPEGLDISQNDTNTVRVVYETENLPKLTSNLEDSTRAFTLPIPGSSANNSLNTRPVEPGSEAPAPTSPPQGAGGSGTNQVGTITVALESARSTTLDMPLSRPLAGPVRMKRVNATTVEVILPGATYQAPMQPLNSYRTTRVGRHLSPDFPRGKWLLDRKNDLGDLGNVINKASFRM